VVFPSTRRWLRKPLGGFTHNKESNMRNIGNSPCPCGEWIMGTLTGNVKKCEKHPGELCWLWEWEAGTVCPKCGATQTFLLQPESRPAPHAVDGRTVPALNKEPDIQELIDDEIYDFLARH